MIYSRYKVHKDYYYTLQQPRQEYIDRWFIQDHYDDRIALVPLNHHKILEDNYYLSIVKRQYSQRSLIKELCVECLKHSRDLIRMIEEELNR